MNPALLALLGARVAAATFNPASISGLDLWLKADAITGLSDGNPVSTWTDSSSAGNHATQDTADFKPIYRTADINGLPSVYFDNTDDRLSVPTTTIMSALAQTIFAVIYRNASTAFQFIVSAGNGKEAIGALGLRLTDTGHSQLTKIGVTDFGTSTSVVPTLAWSRVTGAWSDANNLATYRINGAGDGTFTSPQNLVSRSGAWVGWNGVYGIQPLNGRIAELLHYSAALSAGDIANVEGYLAAKYGL